MTSKQNDPENKSIEESPQLFLKESPQQFLKESPQQFLKESPQQFLDATRLLCPMPVIKTQKAIESLKAGDILDVHCTDPGVKHDIPSWCRVHGHEVLNISDDPKTIIIRIKVMK